MDNYNWNGAPPWAKWLAQDEDGTWFVYAQQPSPHFDIWFSEFAYSLKVGQGEPNPNWKDTLQKRPK